MYGVDVESIVYGVYLFDLHVYGGIYFCLTGVWQAPTSCPTFCLLLGLKCLPIIQSRTSICLTVLQLPKSSLPKSPFVSMQLASQVTSQ